MNSATLSLGLQLGFALRRGVILAFAVACRWFEWGGDFWSAGVLCDCVLWPVLVERLGFSGISEQFSLNLF